MRVFLRNLRKTYIFYADHVVANWPKLTVSVQNQTTEGLFEKWLLSIGYFQLQNLQIEWQKLIKQKLEIWKLKMDDSFYRCLNLSVVLNFGISNVDLYFLSNAWLKYQRSMPTEIKTSLKLSHQIFIQPRLWSVAAPWLLFLSCQLTDTFL